MSIPIYPQETFERQHNGTIYYKEGKLNDFPQARDGIFQSWRYNFDAGRQVFRAKDEDGAPGKLWEKRLVKDIYGNPTWTGWMELPEAEINGIQAIAINDRPLQLPNADGAIKLQITPQIIDTFTKQEIYDLISKKINDNNDRTYIYVSWCIDPKTGDWCETPEDVLNQTFMDGGMTENFYLVEPKPGTDLDKQEATYWIWDLRQHDKHQGVKGSIQEGWIEVGIPDMRAFVTYPAHHQHTNNWNYHLSGDFEREAWNNASGLLHEVSGYLNEAFDETRNQLDHHINDIGNVTSPHFSPEERAMLEYTYGAIQPLPEDNDRFIATNGVFEKAFEQIGEEEDKTQVLEGGNLNKTFSGRDNDIVIDQLALVFNEFKNRNCRVKEVKIEINNVAVGALNIEAWFETDLYSATGHRPKHRSRTFDFKNTVDIWKIKPLETFNNIRLRVRSSNSGEYNTNMPINIGSFRITFTYAQMQTVDIGDRRETMNDRLALNLVGPKWDPDTGEGEPLYNGTPLSHVITKGEHHLKASWGKIEGDIQEQTDLFRELDVLLANKINIPMNDDHANWDRNHERWDIYRNVVIPSLIQQPESESKRIVWVPGMSVWNPSTHPNYVETGVPPASQYSKPTGVNVGDEIFHGLLPFIASLEKEGFIVFNSKLKVQAVASLMDGEDKYIPIHFRTDNKFMPASPSVTVGSFGFNKLDEEGVLVPDTAGSMTGDTINWPGASLQKFDKVFVRGNGAAALTNISVELWVIQYADVIAEARSLINSDQFPEGTLLNWTQNALNYNLNTDENLNYTISGNVHGYVVKDQIENISGNVTSHVEKDVTSTISGNLKLEVQETTDQHFIGTRVTQLDGNEEISVIGNYNLTTETNMGITVDSDGSDEDGNFTIDVEKDLDIKATDAIIETEHFSLTNAKDIRVVTEELRIDAEKFNLTADDIVIGEDERIEYGDTHKLNVVDQVYVYERIEEHPEIKVYGQEIDSRYAGREFTDAISGDFKAVSVLLENEVDERTRENVRIEKEYKEEVERLDEKIDTLEDSIPGIVKDNFDENIKPYITEEDIRDEFYTKKDVYTKTETVSTIHSEANEWASYSIEQFDLVIEDNVKFNEWLNDGTFELAERILFKQPTDGVNYSYVKPENDRKVIDFSNIKFIKGEEYIAPIDLNEAEFKNDSYDNMLLENIEIFGNLHKKETYLNAYGSSIKTYTIDKVGDAGTTTIELDKYHSVYKIVLLVDAQVQFTNVINGRHYTFYVEQGKDGQICNFKINNHLHNAVDLYEVGLENLEINAMSVIHAIGYQENDRNGLVIKQTTPNVKNIVIDGISILLGNIKGEFPLNSTFRGTEDAVKLFSKNKDLMSMGDSRFRSLELDREKVTYIVRRPGEKIFINSLFTNKDADRDPNLTTDSELSGICNGWTHNYELGYDWEIIDVAKENSSEFANRVLARGRVMMGEHDKVDGTGNVFVFPEVKDTDTGIYDLRIDFRPVPHIVTVDINRHLPKNLIHSSHHLYDDSGYNMKFQSYYDEIKFELNLVPDAGDVGYFIHSLKNNTGENTNRHIIKNKWDFKITRMPVRGKIWDDKTYEGNALTSIDANYVPTIDEPALGKFSQVLVMTPFIYRKIFYNGTKPELSVVNNFTSDKKELIYYEDDTLNKIDIDFINKEFMINNDWSQNPLIRPEPVYITMYDTTQIKVILFKHSDDITAQLSQAEVINMYKFGIKLLEKPGDRDFLIIPGAPDNKNVVKLRVVTPSKAAGSTQAFDMEGKTPVYGDESLWYEYTFRQLVKLENMKIVQDLAWLDTNVGGQPVNTPRAEERELFDNSRLILRKSTIRKEDYRFRIMYHDDETFVTNGPSYRDGTWEIINQVPYAGGDGAVATIKETIPSNDTWNDEKNRDAMERVDIYVERRGTFTLKFTNAFDPSQTVYQDIRVEVHPEAAVMVAPVTTTIGQTYTPEIIWQKGGFESDANTPINYLEIDDTTGNWTYDVPVDRKTYGPLGLDPSQDAGAIDERYLSQFGLKIGDLCTRARFVKPGMKHFEENSFFEPVKGPALSNEDSSINVYVTEEPVIMSNFLGTMGVSQLDNFNLQFQPKSPRFNTANKSLEFRTSTNVGGITLIPEVKHDHSYITVGNKFYDFEVFKDDVDETTILNVSANPANKLVMAESNIVITVTFAMNYRVHDDTLAIIRALPHYEELVSTPGNISSESVFRFVFKMPYRNLSLDIKAQKI